MFKARTSRTLLIIFGIGIGMATILFLTSLGFGVQRVVLSQITTFDSLSAIDIYANLEKGKKINWASLEQLEYVKELEKIVPLLRYDGQVKVGDFSSSTALFITEAGYTGMDGKVLEAGRDLSEGKEREVVLASSFLNVLNKSPDDLLGEEIEIILHIPDEGVKWFTERVLETKFKIVGIVKNDKSNVYINSNSLEGEMLSSIFSIKAKTGDPKQVDMARSKIEALGFKTSSVSEIVNQARTFFSAVSAVLAILGIIALSVSAIGMFNTMIITLLERTEEIGIMKAIGATDRNILSIFIFESALMGFLGGVVGVVGGILAQSVSNFIVNFMAVRMGGEAFTLFYSPAWFVILLVVISLMIGVVTGLIPARKASAVDPLEALKRR